MTTPIRPMSAEEAIQSATALFMKETELDKLKVNSSDLAFANQMQQAITDAYRASVRHVVRQALASHLAYVREKAQKFADENKEYYNAYAEGFDDCTAVIQSEIDELTK